MSCMRCTKKHPEHKYYIGLAGYLFFMFYCFLGHCVFLMYSHYMVLEYLDARGDKSFLGVIASDGAVAYGAIALMGFMLMGMTILACCAELEIQKKYILILTGITMFLGFCSTMAQVSLVVYKDINLFLGQKAVNIADCYCTEERNETAMIGVSSLNRAYGEHSNLALLPDDLIDVARAFEQRMKDDCHQRAAEDVCRIQASIQHLLRFYENVGSRYQDGSQISSEDEDQLWWCRCNVPDEVVPVAFSLDDFYNMELDMDYLSQFTERDRYRGNVTTYVVDTKDQVIEKTDHQFKEMAMLYAVAELSIIFVVLRLPLFSLMKKVRVVEAGLKVCAEDDTLKGNILRALTHKDLEEKSTETLKVYLELTSFSFVESLDAFALLDETLQHRYTFGRNNSLKIALMALVLLNTVVVNLAGICLFIGDKKASVEEETALKMKTAQEWTRLSVVLLSNVPFMILRCILLYVYEEMENIQDTSVYYIFIVKEFVMIWLGISEFVVGLKMNKASAEESFSPTTKNKSTLSVKSLISLGSDKITSLPSNDHFNDNATGTSLFDGETLAWLEQLEEKFELSIVSERL